jgi:uncharacterized membrane protein
MEKMLIKKIVGMMILVLFAGLNLVWKFSMGNFSAMGDGRQLNVVASIIFVFLGIIVIGRLSYTLYKESKTNIL